jgi:hypothetical protein
MKALWLIETGVFPRSAPDVLEALEARGISWLRYEEGLPESSLPPGNACVVFWGSLGAAYDQRVASRWVPGAFGDADGFRCSVYHAKLAPVLANGFAVFTTVKDLVAEPSTVLQPLGNPDTVFVRPDSALKPFAGRQLAISSLSLAALDHGFYYDDERLPIVVSSAKQVGREWRFVIAEGAVVAGCEYDVGRRGRETPVPEDAALLAAHVARAEWQPAPVYVVDVGELAGVMRVMEINPFSGADLYECDAQAVVETVTRAALRLHGSTVKTDLAPRG